MEITHVLRGDDHVNNTPRQINIYRAFGAKLPQFGHLPMMGFLRRLPPLLLWALTIGALRTTNTWDVPPHLLVVLGALIIAEYSGQNAGGMPSLPGAQRQVPFLRPLGTVVWEFGLVFVLSWSVLYRPFWASYGSFYNSIALWTGTRTALWAYLVVHGLFLFVIVSYLCARVIGDWRHERCCDAST